MCALTQQAPLTLSKCCSLFIFPNAGPDIKYLLGFIRTQLSTSVTVGLVFAPKVGDGGGCFCSRSSRSLALAAHDSRCYFVQVVRVLRGHGDQWDNRARAKGVTASFSLNGIGLVPEETADLYQENEELKASVCQSGGRPKPQRFEILT